MKGKTKKLFTENGISKKTIETFEKGFTLAEMYLGCETKEQNGQILTLGKECEMFIQGKYNEHELTEVLEERVNKHFAWVFYNL